ncbi:MAG: hypothetical protein AAF466_00925 [Bacteroidota bacterium]
MNKKETNTISVPMRIKAGLAAGLYPFLHFYSNNFNIADSWVQFGFMVSLCLLLPVAIALVLPKIFELGPLKKLKKYSLTAFNLVFFICLLSLMIFHFKNMMLGGLLLAGGLLSLVAYRHLGKIVLLQFLLAVMSLFTLVPRLAFVLTYDDSWKEIAENLDEVTFKETPNIYVIQPDGYANFSVLRKPPYSNLDTTFEDYLVEKGFTNYRDTRSNYFNTLTSNTSAFAMKHHYYGNVNRKNEKTQDAMEDIVGDNAALRILKNNNYTTHLFTDNSFFLLNRKRKAYDHCNIANSDLPMYRLGGLPGIDIIADLTESHKNEPEGPNFYFIERTVPGHIKTAKMGSAGAEKEREKWLASLERANDWLTQLIDLIDAHDPDALIVIMADHGGSVGLEYSAELKERTLNAEETLSVFSVITSIKWPDNEVPEGLQIKTNVNLFRNLFYHLSGNSLLMKSYQPDKTFVYNLEEGPLQVYECIDENGKYGYKKLDNQ